MTAYATTGWAYAMNHVVCVLSPEPFQVIASSPAEVAESVIALAAEQTGLEWDDEDRARDWDRVAQLWADRWPEDIRVVPA